MHLNTIDFNLVPLTSAMPGFERVWQLQTVDGETFDFIEFSSEENSKYIELAKRWQPLVLECFFDKSKTSPALLQLAALNHHPKKVVVSALMTGQTLNGQTPIDEEP